MTEERAFLLIQYEPFRIPKNIREYLPGVHPW